MEKQSMNWFHYIFHNDTFYSSCHGPDSEQGQRLDQAYYRDLGLDPALGLQSAAFSGDLPSQFICQCSSKPIFATKRLTTRKRTRGNTDTAFCPRMYSSCHSIIIWILAAYDIVSHLQYHMPLFTICHVQKWTLLSTFHVHRCASTHTNTHTHTNTNTNTSLLHSTAPPSPLLSSNYDLRTSLK